MTVISMFMGTYLVNDSPCFANRMIVVLLSSSLVCDPAAERFLRGNSYTILGCILRQDCAME